MLRTIRTLAIPLGMGLLALQSALADDWCTWRGPHQDGHVVADGYFGDGPIGLELVWHQQIGAGYSGLAVSRGRLFVPYADGQDDWLAALDARSGRPLWKFRIGPMYPAHDGGHDGPLSTPVADKDRLYFLGPRGTLFVLDLATGATMWSVDLAQKYAAKTPFWGFCTTPAINDDSLFVQVSGDSKNGIVAFDKADGTVKWSQQLAATDYRSPVLTQLDGKQQLVCCSQQETCGFDPGTGEKLWTIPFVSAGEMTPVFVAGSQILLTGRAEVQLYDLPSGSERRWTAPEFRGTYGTPVFYKKHLYGFSRHALTCVDANSGQRVWRSRAPGGGKGQIVVDGHLVIFSVKGDLLVVKATSERYVERARLALSSADGYASPIFADGLIYVRDLNGKIFAVAAANRPELPTHDEEPENDFERFVASLEIVEDKEQAIAAFLAEQDSFPIVADDRLVHFVFRGSAKDVAVRGSMIAAGEEDAMRRVPGTDFFYRSYAIEPGARWEYEYVVDFDRSIRDPLHGRTSPFDGSVSELATAGWSEPRWAAQYTGQKSTGQKRGRLQPVAYDGRTAQVYLPYEYDKTEKDYKLLVVADGSGWMQEGAVLDLLDRLDEAGHLSRTIVAFPQHRGHGGSNTPTYARQIADKLVTSIDQNFRTQRQRESRSIVGKRGAAVAAVYTALRYPDVFGNCIAISYGRADTVRKRTISDLITNFQGDKPRFHIAWNRYEVWRPQSFHCRDQSRALSRLLSHHEFDVTGGERNDSANWRSWRVLLGRALVAEGE